MENVIILGGGLSGLGCALTLPDSTIYEASDHPGGHGYSHKLNGFAFDEGAHICHSKDQGWLDLIFNSIKNSHYSQHSCVKNYWEVFT